MLLTPKEKQELVIAYGRQSGLDILIETGTFLGDMVEACRAHFRGVYSIELGHELHERARARFRDTPNVHLFEGDSGQLLQDVLKTVDRPALLWIDAHCSEGITVGDPTNPPLLQELAAIFASLHRHVVLIDDARGYVLEDVTKHFAPYYQWEVRDDVIRAWPRPASIVVLGKYPDIFEGFLVSAEKFAPQVPKILVRDGEAIQSPAGWTVCQGPATFSMAGNANLGWKAIVADSDLLYCGDDVRFLQENTVEDLQRIAYSDPGIGILSPRIRGGVNNEIQRSPEREITYTANLAFPCVFIKREILDRVGYLDERFIDYGYDDDEFCARVRAAGYKLAVTNRVTVEHQSTSTFLRNHGGDPRPIVEQMNHNRELWANIQAGKC